MRFVQPATTIQTPELDEDEIAIVAINHNGNHTIVTMRRKTFDQGELTAHGHQLRLLVQRLDDLP